MKKPLSIITATAILAGCSQSTAVKFTLTGRDPAFTDGKYMYIITYAGGPETIIDSARIDNSSFAMKGSWPYPVSAFLYIGRGADGEQISDSDFILETGEIRVEKRNEDEFILTGTPQNEFRNELPQKVAGLRQKGLSPLRTAEACDSLFRAVVLENRNALRAIPAGERITDQSSRTRASAIIGFVPGCISKASRPCSDCARRSPECAPMSEHLMPTSRDRRPKGDTVSLAATVRKPGNRYVLLDFGALCGGPCRAELPNLAALYENTTAGDSTSSASPTTPTANGGSNASRPTACAGRRFIRDSVCTRARHRRGATIRWAVSFLLPDRLCDGKDHSQTTAGRSPRTETLRTARLTAYEPPKAGRDRQCHDFFVYLPKTA